MKIAIVGSRTVKAIDPERFVSENDEIITGGAKGADACAAEYARKKGLKLTVILPEYDRYGRGAPIVRNRQIVDLADKVVAFWDTRSRGTQYVIEYAKKMGKPCEIIVCE